VQEKICFAMLLIISLLHFFFVSAIRRPRQNFGSSVGFLAKLREVVQGLNSVESLWLRLFGESSEQSEGG